jgi:hypothetical protein
VELIKLTEVLEVVDLPEYSCEKDEEGDKVMKRRLYSNKRRVPSAVADRERSLQTSFAHIVGKDCDQICKELIVLLESDGDRLQGLFHCFAKDIDTYILQLKSKSVVQPSHFDIILLSLLIDKVIRVATSTAIFCYDPCYLHSSIAANKNTSSDDEIFLAFTSEEWFMTCQTTDIMPKKGPLEDWTEINVLLQRKQFD